MRLTKTTALLIDVEPGTPIRFLEKEYTFKEGWYHIQTPGLPEETVLCAVDKHYVPNHVYVYLFNKDFPNKPVQKAVPVTQKVEVLGAAEARPLMEVWNQTKMARFAGWIPPTSTSMQLGTDPEVFVENEGKLLPAFEFLPPKEKHLKATGMYSGNVYCDGFQGEFTVQPSSCLAWVVDGIHATLKSLLKEARSKHPAAKLSVKTVVEIDHNLLIDGKKEHVELGCMPSKNVYGSKGQIPESGRTLPIRMTGGHMHFSPNYNEEQITNAIRLLDRILGVPSVSLFANYDHPARRQFYGLAGEYRTPKWGLEYRTMSNAWLVHPAIMHLVFDLGRLAVQLSINKEFSALFDASDEDVQEIINTCDVAKSRKYLTKYKDSWLVAMNKAKHTETAATSAYKTFMEGADSIMSHPGDMEKNWSLDEVSRSANAWVGHSEGYGKNWERAVRILSDGGKV